jgi:hypothetical protein
MRVTVTFSPGGESRSTGALGHFSVITSLRVFIIVCPEAIMIP